MKTTLTILGMAAVLSTAGCNGLFDDATHKSLVLDGGVPLPAGMTLEDEDEQEIPLSEVPDAVKQAALAEVPGLVLTEAEVEVEDGMLVYELEGFAGDEEYEIEVTTAGKVTEVGREGDDEDDD